MIGMIYKRAALAFALAMACNAAAAGETLLEAAMIRTMDTRAPIAKAMVYDDGGTILALGDTADMARQYPRAKRVDFKAATVIPGLIDAHGHVLGLGMMHLRADLVGTSSKAEVIARLKAFVTRTKLPAGAWLIGRGWDQNRWPEKAFPSAADLDAAFPDRPVWLNRIDGHAAWGNTLALKAATRSLDGDWQPEGGRIERRNGKATGIFIDEAAALIDSQVPQTDPAVSEQALQLAVEDMVAHGLTGVHDAGIDMQTFALYRRMADAGRLSVRITAMAGGDGKALDFLCASGLYQHPSHHLKMRTVKLFADGALGSRGAALLDDYSDDHGNHGILVTSPAELMRITRKAASCNVQVATHAIGDRGNRIVLDTYAAALGPAATTTDHRWRIEHAQVVALADIPRFKELHLIASMQPTHATSDMPWAQDRVGAERIQGAYAWRKMRDAGVPLAFGSDFPVESVDPRLGLYSAVTRTDEKHLPAGGWTPQEKVTAWEALRGFTLDAAYAGFAEEEVGSLAVGKRADFVVLTEDPITIAPEKLRELTVQSTWVDGKAVYRLPPPAHAANSAAPR